MLFSVHIYFFIIEKVYDCCYRNEENPSYFDAYNNNNTGNEHVYT